MYEKEEEVFQSEGNNVSRSTMKDIMKNKRKTWLNCELQQGDEWEMSLKDRLGP